jgi:multidrug resistance efflux pump
MSVQVQEQRPHPAGPPADGNGNGRTVASPPPDTETETESEKATPSAPASAMRAAAPPMAAEPAARSRPRILSRRVLLPLVAVIVIAAAVFGFNTYREGQRYVSTENALLTGQPVQVGSMNAGRVESITPTIGSSVHKGDVIAQVALPSQVGMGQNGQPKMGFLGAGDTRVDVQAPIDGIVIAEPVGIGATVAAGQAIVAIVDPTQLWVNANIEETNIGKLKDGQAVTVHVDALNADIPGKVEAVTPATANTFSLLPTSNTSGNFTKVIQLVPVRISVNLGNQPLLLGANVEVKIRVAD